LNAIIKNEMYIVTLVDNDNPCDMKEVKVKACVHKEAGEKALSSNSQMRLVAIEKASRRKNKRVANNVKD